MGCQQSSIPVRQSEQQKERYWEKRDRGLTGLKLIFCAEIQRRNSVAYNRTHRREFGGGTQYPPENVGAPQGYERVSNRQSLREEQKEPDESDYWQKCDRGLTCLNVVSPVGSS